MDKMLEALEGGDALTLYRPMTHICVMSSHKPLRVYMGGLILAVNILYRRFCYFKLFPMVGKGLSPCQVTVRPFIQYLSLSLYSLSRWTLKTLGRLPFWTRRWSQKFTFPECSPQRYTYRVELSVLRCLLRSVRMTIGRHPSLSTRSSSLHSLPTYLPYCSCRVFSRSLLMISSTVSSPSPIHPPPLRVPTQLSSRNPPVSRLALIPHLCHAALPL